MHARHNCFIQAHDERGNRELGRLVAEAGKRCDTAVAECYLTRLMQALPHRATPAKNANVLMHVPGYVKKTLASADRAELPAMIHALRQHSVPLIVPMTLIRRLLRDFRNE